MVRVSDRVKGNNLDKLCHPRSDLNNYANSQTSDMHEIR